MKVQTVCIVAALAALGVTKAYAADANPASITRDYTDTVAPAQQAAYEAGEKAWNECLRQHGFKYDVIALQHATGNTYTYAYEIGPYSWADFDRMHATENACDATVSAQLNPHLRNETSTFFVDQPDMSYLPAGARTLPPPPLIDIVAYTLKPDHAAYETFTSAVKKITAASIKTRSLIYYSTMAVQAGGEGAPDYVVAIGRKNWSDYGTLVNSSLRKMLEGVYGKSATDALLKSFEESIAKASEHVDSYNADLSYLAGK
ncbi:MAG TPA: hypothetical protein VFQ95_01010 [Rhodanobacteraceae bacterium]|nr:hypothetical protein [Rhodanobacteraceae bacterium]